MDSLVSLKYPNGRNHEQSLTTAGALTRGFEFNLYGWHWRTIGSYPTVRPKSKPLAPHLVRVRSPA